MFDLRKILCKLLHRKAISLLTLMLLLAVTQSYAQDRTLQWGISEPDLVGYKIYFGFESRYPSNPSPYNALGSPIDIILTEDQNPDPNIVEYTVTGLDDNEVYFFAVSAVRSDAREGDYSNEEAILCITWTEGGFYVNQDNDSPYAVRGRADNNTVAELYHDYVSQETKLGEATADDNRDWEIAVDFESEFGEGPVTLIVKSNAITAPDVIATYDPTDPTSTANSPASASGTVFISWTAFDATSGVASTDLWHKTPGGTWARVGLSQGGTSGTFYYVPPQGDGTYYFATRSVDRAGNWEIAPSGDGDTSTEYTAPSNPLNTLVGKDGGGGCFIEAAAHR